MLKFFSIFLFSILPIYSCSQDLEPLVCNSLNGDIIVQIGVNGIGTVSKRKAISLEKLYVILVTPDQTTILNFDLLPEYSILVSKFYPFNNRINKCKRSIDYEKAVAPSFQKQTSFDDAVSLTNDYDYLTTSTDGILHNIPITAYGNFNGRIMKIPIIRYYSDRETRFLKAH